MNRYNPPSGDRSRQQSNQSSGYPSQPWSNAPSGNPNQQWTTPFGDPNQPWSNAPSGDPNQQYDYRNGQYAYSSATPGDTNREWYPYHQSNYDTTLVPPGPNPHHPGDFITDEEPPMAYGQADPQHTQGPRAMNDSGRETAVFSGNVYRGGGNQRMGVKLPPSAFGPVDAESVLTTSGNMVYSDNKFEPSRVGHKHVGHQDVGHQIMGLMVPPGRKPIPIAGQYRGNINDGPGDQNMGITWEC